MRPDQGFRIDYLPQHLEFDQNARRIHAAWEVNVTDLLFPDESLPSAEFSDRGHADFDALGTEKFDLGLSLNPDLITHAMDLSIRNRGLLKDIPDDASARHPTLFRLASPPIFEGVDNHPAFGRVWKARMTLGATLPGLGSRFFRSNEAMLDVVALLAPRIRNSREIEFVLLGLDASRSRLVPDSIRTGAMKALVNAFARDALRRSAQGFERSTPVLYVYPLSPTYLGLPIRLRRAAIDSGGHLLLALDQVVTKQRNNPRNPEATPLQ